MVKRLIKKKKKKKLSLWIKLFILISAVIAFDLAYYSVIIDVKKYATENPVKTAFMKYRETQWRAKGRTIKIKQVWVPLNKISPNIRKAVIVSEDARFWKHDGFDFNAMRKAFEINIEKRTMALGASTITMQLAKNLYLSPSKNPVRKIHEAILTWRIERALSKNRILELYLNTAEWGDGIFGIEMASRTYYGHSALELTRDEAVRLAAVLPNPILYNPLKNSRFVSRRSRLIARALGGDMKAAIALHETPQKKEPDRSMGDTVIETIQATADTIADSGVILFPAIDSSQITPSVLDSMIPSSADSSVDLL
ncbi:MAG: monofunctional biosynthetic peptidoglycan transglycosylase [Fibrobacter sp.]|nr:monofunctional biosynthetic peptidoglycan transglycosylase [Fibrobacter sp.]